MIYAGAYKLANSVGLKSRHIWCRRKLPTPKIDADEVVYIHGGGGFNAWWDRTPQILRQIRTENPGNIIIVGPTTVDTDREYLDKALTIDGQMTFFAREKTTYGIIREYYGDARLDHDTALHLKLGDRYLDRLVGYLKPRKKFSLLALRDDCESGEVPESIDPEEFDIVVDPCKTGKWALLHLNAAKIVTNRSHSAILGALLGKDTTLFAGSYHKNRSIWEHSLRQRGVKWAE